MPNIIFICVCVYIYTYIQIYTHIHRSYIYDLSSRYFDQERPLNFIMTGVRKLQEAEGWDIFLQWSCNSLNRNLKAYYRPGTPAVHVWVGVEISC